MPSPERPLLVLPAPGEPEKRGPKAGGGGTTRLPTRARQAERLTPKFEALQRAFDARRASLQTDAVGLVPEEVVVLETVGPIEDFIVAVRKIDGLEWLGEVEEEGIPPDDDFFVVDRQGAVRTDKLIRGRLFMVFVNQQALQQLLSLWGRWKAGERMPHGLAKCGAVFAQLRDVRPWNVQDRLNETGVLLDWSERVTHNQEAVPCEIELWFRNDPGRRKVASARVGSLVASLGGKVLQESTIEEIAYHAVLAQLPIAAVKPLIKEAGRDAALVQCEQIQFFRAAGQMVGIVGEEQHQADLGPVPVAPPDLGEPVVALLDGLPLQGHRYLAGRLVVDDPDGYEERYPANKRCHGTSMASLILHGDLDAGETPLARRLYVRPILRPDPRAWTPRVETVSERVLVVDLVHRAVHRIFESEGEEPPAAPHVCVVNLSVGIRDRLFDGAMSPLARLLDWLAWKYRVLFVVSAGNHPHDIEIAATREESRALSPAEFQTLVIQAVAADARNRRLLSPAEAVNVITVGAVHRDASSGAKPPYTIQPFIGDVLPSVVNAQGMGYRRAVKPDVFLPGGRVVLRESVRTSRNATFEVVAQTWQPGQRTAAPGQTPGDLGSTWHSRGTSNATALASRTASELYDVLEELRDQPGGELIEELPRAVWLKALLMHSASWGDAGRELETILRTPENARQFKEYLTRLLGYGAIDPSRVKECTLSRVTALGGGHVRAEQAHVHRIPLPPGLSGQRGFRRLTITLAWLTPTNASLQAWRRADLWFTPSADPLQVKRQQADWQAVRRGTVQHEILEGESAAAFVDGTSLEIRVNCRPCAGALEDPVPYALATTLEVAEEIGVDIYNEIRVRVRAGRIQVAPGR